MNANQLLGRTNLKLLLIKEKKDYNDNNDWYRGKTQMNVKQFLGKTGRLPLLLKKKKHHNDEEESGLVWSGEEEKIIFKYKIK